MTAQVKSRRVCLLAGLLVERRKLRQNTRAESALNYMKTGSKTSFRAELAPAGIHQYTRCRRLSVGLGRVAQRESTTLTS